MNTPVDKPCEFAGGCDRQATRLFPVKGWLCDEHFQQTLNALAEMEAADRRKLDAEWEAHFEKYLRESNLNPAQLSETQARQIQHEVRRWLHAKRVEKGQTRRRE